MATNESLFPESLYTVTVTDSHIRYRDPDGGEVELEWSDLRRVEIQTTDEGPMLPDFFWVLIGRVAECWIVQGASGEQALVARLQQLPGFNHEQMGQAMLSTSNKRFVCWQRQL